MNRALRTTLAITALLASSALTACGVEPVEAASATKPVAELRQGSIVSIRTPAGLSCQVFDTTKAGGLSCDFESFTVPEAWEGRVGSMEYVATENGNLEVVLLEGGTLCASMDGTHSGDLECRHAAK